MSNDTAEDVLYSRVSHAVSDYVYGEAVAGSLLMIYIITTVTLELVPYLRSFSIVSLFYRIVTMVALAHVFIIYSFMPDFSNAAKITMWILSWAGTVVAILVFAKSAFVVIVRLIVFRSFTIAMGPQTMLIVNGTIVPSPTVPTYLAVRRNGNFMRLDVANRDIPLAGKSPASIPILGLSRVYTLHTYAKVAGSDSRWGEASGGMWFKADHAPADTVRTKASPKLFEA